ncbi:MAG: low molecular weight protein-tyrosine-phosphatase [Bacteroidota bacterium]
MKINVLFVCLGNICRSPSGEAVFTKMVQDAGLQDSISVDSAGIIDYHEGNPADERMQQHAEKRDYNLTSISRPVSPAKDARHFDYIIAMDTQNFQDLKALLPKEHHHKIHLMNDFSENNKGKSVPDPYFGGSEGFELVLDMLEDACRGLLKDVKQRL